MSQKRHAFFTSQGDIVKLGLENCSLSGAFLKTLLHTFIMFYFLLKGEDGKPIINTVLPHDIF